MRMSQYFLPTMKENPSEAQIVSHRLMLRAGLIRQTSAGIYAWLPLGFRVLKNIERIVREEQDASGAQEVLMPTIQSADLWRESGRYDAYGPEMLRIKDRHDREMLFGPTNEEMITVLFRDGVKSYRDLPKNLYHIQWKFRDEVRPRFGVMRGREFLMKDAYSFDIDQAGARHSYNKMFVAYLRTFARLGLKAIPMVADTGPIGGNLSHEFIILASTGESEVFCHKDYLDFPVPAADVDFNNIAGLQAHRAGRPGRILAVIEPRSNTMKLGTMKSQLPWSLEQTDLAICHSGGLDWSAEQALAPMGAKAQVAASVDEAVRLVVAQARDGDHVDHAGRYRRTDEYTSVMRRVWTEDAFDHEGRFFKLKGAYGNPRPIQQPFPMVMNATKMLRTGFVMRLKMVRRLSI